MTLATGELGSGSLGTGDSSIRFNGGGYFVQLNPTTVSFTGQSFVASLTSVVDTTNYLNFLGTGYAVIPEFIGGFWFEKGSYSVVPNFKLTPDYNINFSSGGYAARLISTLVSPSVINFEGKGYKVIPEMLGGFYFTGRGARARLSASVATSERISFTGHGFQISLSSSVAVIENIAFAGRGFKADIFQDKFIGRGYKVEPLFSFAPDAEYAEAFVMNLALNAKSVTRYQNYPFNHLARIGNTYYGTNENGLYELTGEYDLDEGTLVNGTIHTHTTDYGVFNSKNVPYVYLNGDDDYSVTAYVDDVEQPAFTSGFGGRRVKLARGNKGRYWEFKVEGIRKLQGIEHLPDGLSRRVK